MISTTRREAERLIGERNLEKALRQRHAPVERNSWSELWLLPGGGKLCAQARGKHHSYAIKTYGVNDSDVAKLMAKIRPLKAVAS